MIKQIIFLCALLALCGEIRAESATETNALGNVVSIDRFERYRVGRTYYAYVQVPTNMLATIVPPAAGPIGQVVIAPAVYDETGTNLVAAATTRQKTMAEALLKPIRAAAAPYCVAPLGFKDAPWMRHRAVGRDELLIYEVFYTQAGLPITAWLTMAQRDAILSQPPYVLEVAE